MSAQLQSFLAGTSALTALILIAGWITLSRPRIRFEDDGERRFVIVAAIAIEVQAVHFLEELVAGFALRFPAALGLEPWNEGLFVVFNAIWLGIWTVALVGVRRRIVLALWPLWFLGMGLVANGVAHPVLALRAGGYFPGLITAPFAAIAGVVLLRELGRISSDRGAAWTREG